MMKKKLNKKGFTLVELLATVVILLAVSTVAITSISASLDRQNQKKDLAVKEMIVGLGTLYLEEHINDPFSSTAGEPCVNVSTLKTEFGVEDKSLILSTGDTLVGSVRFRANKYGFYENAC